MNTITPNGIFEKEYLENNNLYLIKLQSSSNEIQITIRDLNDIEEISNVYKGCFSFDKLAGNNKYLKRMDIENMYEILIDVINSKKLSISKQNQTIISSWKFIIIKEIEIKLILQIEKNDDKETIQQLVGAVKNLNKQNSILKNEIENIKKDIDNLKNLNQNNNDLKNEIENIKKDI